MSEQLLDGLNVLSIELFIARFRPEAYVLTPRENEMIEIRPALPEDVEQKRQASAGESEFRLLAHSMALRARKILNSGENSR